ncbi:DUF7521 family protein [Natrarchaeobius chitinivorans]|uniref:Uncharacterized protein n=1 Tax=Natrarchaeobius chitinivorans TaxID=1679083 RepID=A0A3N6P813_NATCH|nr:hypothetical protein [Natrarchaeobius chitinivorans]RQG94699.1 hypothetical protein EA473_11195 [Natrarchaeobius chitinivorans]
MDEYTLIIAVANTATLLTGGAVATFSYRAYRRTGSRSLKAVAAGFVFIVVGSVVGGVVHLLEGNVALGVAIQSSFVAGGFGILLYSLYVETATTRTETVAVTE